MHPSNCIDSLQEGQVEVGRIVFGGLLFHVDSLRGKVRYLLIDIDGVDCVEFLDLPLLLVKVHDDGLVVGLAEAGDEVVVLRHHDSIDGRYGVGHIVEELAPEPVTVGRHCVNIAVRILGRSIVAGISQPADKNIVSYRIHRHSVHMLFLKATREDGELFVRTGLIFETLGCHSQSTQEDQGSGSAVSELAALFLHIEDILL